MKVVCSTLRYYPAIGGAEIVLQEVCERLAKDGFRFKILATSAEEAHDIFNPNPKTAKEKIDFINNIEVVRSPISKVPLKPTLAHILDWFSIYGHGAYSAKQFRHLMKDDYDVIHSSPFPSTHNYYTFLAAKIRKKPIVVSPHLHLTDIYHSRRKSLFLMMKHASAVMANTIFEKNFYEKQGVPSNKIFVTGVGINPNDYKKPQNPQFLKNKANKNYVTFIGRKEEYKGIKTIINAIDILIDKYPRINFICAGPETPFSKDLIGKKNPRLKNNIINLGKISKKQKNDILAATDVFVCPSTAESFGIVYLEAWMHEKPVIGVNSGAVSSVISNGKDGLLIKPNNHIELADKIEFLLNNKAEAFELGKKGKQKVLANYTWDIVAEKWKNVFKAVV